MNTKTGDKLDIVVVGAGSWGTALALSAARAGQKVCIWSRNQDIVTDINSKKRNSKYFGDFSFKEDVTASLDLEIIKTAKTVILAIPVQQLRTVCLKLKDLSLAEDVVFVISSKGIEQGSLKLPSDLVAEFFPNNKIALISGPNFADEVAKGLPACATFAMQDKNLANNIISQVGNKLFRLYYSDDIVGAQVGGAVKNVIAIASGITIGLGLGENARAAIVTRGMAEITRLALKLGGRAETLSGLSGVGDIMLTCLSNKSRNTSLGFAIAKGEDINKLLNSGVTYEGAKTSNSVCELAQKLEIDMPICCAVKSILYENAGLNEAVQVLLTRPFTAE